MSDDRPDGILRANAQIQRQRSLISANQVDVLNERLSIVIMRARERRSPQVLEIKIMANDDGTISMYIDPTDHYPKVK